MRASSLSMRSSLRIPPHSRTISHKIESQIPSEYSILSVSRTKTVRYTLARKPLFNMGVMRLKSKKIFSMVKNLLVKSWCLKAISVCMTMRESGVRVMRTARHKIMTGSMRRIQAMTHCLMNKNLTNTFIKIKRRTVIIKSSLLKISNSWTKEI